MLNTRLKILSLVGLLLAGVPMDKVYAGAVSAVSPTYGQQVGDKALRGLANIPLSVLELPKNVITTSNQTNFAFGITGGLLKGIVMTVGRIGTGVLELITAPLPTEPIIYPVYPWEDYFEIETTFGPSFEVIEPE